MEIRKPIPEFLQCKACHGVGVWKALDENRIAVDFWCTECLDYKTHYPTGRLRCANCESLAVKLVNEKPYCEECSEELNATTAARECEARYQGRRGRQ